MVHYKNTNKGEMRRVFQYVPYFINTGVMMYRYAPSVIGASEKLEGQIIGGVRSRKGGEK
jgi:hypothetical protein